MDNKEKKDLKVLSTLEPPEISPKGKDLEATLPKPGNEKPEDVETEKVPEVEPVKLTKTQRRLYINRVSDIEAMKSQSVAIIDNLGSEIKRTLVETFAEELGIDLSERKYGFDPQSQSFIDLNKLKARTGQPRMAIPRRKFPN